jgi:diguanylate cyclase (GGDEF)-like protein
MLNVKSERFEKLAKVDPLTSLSNRLDINEFLIKAAQDYCHYGTALSIILLDIDHFKSVNDSYGHDEGDKVLIEVARKMAETIRGSDGLGRWGGEEFLLVCPATELENAEKLAEKLRNSVKSIKYGSGEESITISMGVAQLRNESIIDLIKRTDVALYEAKNTGRDKVILAV